MEVNLDYYKLFYNVAKYQSFSKAAEQLYISQSAITQAIQKLEDILGGKLFYRTTRGVVLTEEEKNLYNFIEESINTLMNAQERFEQYKKLEKGKIIIRGANTPTKFILEKPLLKFLNDYPHIVSSFSHLPYIPHGKIKLLSVIGKPISPALTLPLSLLCKDVFNILYKTVLEIPVV